MSNAESNIVVIFAPKTPYDQLDYSFDYSNWLGPNDSLAASYWTVPDELTYITDIYDSVSNIATVWLTDGNSGDTVVVTNSITTAGGRKKATSFKISII